MRVKRAFFSGVVAGLLAALQLCAGAEVPEYGDQQLVAPVPVATLPNMSSFSHVFNSDIDSVWSAVWDAWSDFSLPDPDRPGDKVDGDKYRVHAQLNPAEFDESWDFETSCCDFLIVDLSLRESGGKTRVTLSLSAGYGVGSCCNLYTQVSAVQDDFFDQVMQNLR